MTYLMIQGYMITGIKCRHYLFISPDRTMDNMVIPDYG